MITKNCFMCGSSKHIKRVKSSIDGEGMITVCTRCDVSIENYHPERECLETIIDEVIVEFTELDSFETKTESYINLDGRKNELNTIYNVIKRMLDIDSIDYDLFSIVIGFNNTSKITRDMMNKLGFKEFTLKDMMQNLDSFSYNDGFIDLTMERGNFFYMATLY